MASPPFPEYLSLPRGGPRLAGGPALSPLNTPLTRAVCKLARRRGASEWLGKRQNIEKNENPQLIQKEEFATSHQSDHLASTFLTVIIIFFGMAILCGCSRLNAVNILSRPTLADISLPAGCQNYVYVITCI
jgi:hypothetical protein